LSYINHNSQAIAKIKGKAKKKTSGEERPKGRPRSLANSRSPPRRPTGGGGKFGGEKEGGCKKDPGRAKLCQRYKKWGKTQGKKGPKGYGKTAKSKSKKRRKKESS